MAKFKSTLDRLRQTIADFTVAQRTLAVLAIAAIIAAGAVLFSFLGRETYTPLFSGLSGADASAIVEQLEAEGVPYQLTGGGTTILVPQEQVHNQRLTAAAGGLPGDSSGGYSLLDDMGVTSSEFQQDVTYKRAIEGELGRTITEMNGLEAATVQITNPEKTVFSDTERTPTASVFVRPEQGKALTADQVEAIVHLTSAAVDGMAPTDVAVIDSDGKVLSQVGVGTKSPDTAATDYEKAVASQVQAMLDNVVGAGNATVAVKADVDSSTSETLTEEFAGPQGTPPLSETTRTEEYEGAGGREAGVLGPDNIAVPDGREGQNTYSSEEATRNNAVNKTTRTTNEPAGRIVRQTVSVAVDQTAAAALDPQGVSDLVAAAAGINEERGDLVELQFVPFNTDAADAAAEALAQADEAAAAAERAKTLRNTVIAAVLIVALVLFLLARASRKRRQRRESLDLGDLGLLQAQDTRDQLDAPDEPLVIELEHEEPALITPPQPRHNDVDERRAQVDALAATDPQKTVDYLRVLLETDNQKVPTR